MKNNDKNKIIDFIVKKNNICIVVESTGVKRVVYGSMGVNVRNFSLLKDDINFYNENHFFNERLID